MRTTLGKLYKQARRSYRLSTAMGRALPDYVVIGAQKGGSTFLYELLCEHPQALPAFSKETHYFDYEYHRGTNWYRSNFPLTIRLKAQSRLQGRPVIAGEATPYYLFHPLAPERITALLPDAKLIAVLRNPVDRAFSHFQMMRRKNVETLEFEDALNEERTRLETALDSLQQNEFDRAEQHQRLSYLARGVYIEQLKKYDQYRQRGQLLVMGSEQLFENPQSYYNQVIDFLGLDAWQLKNTEPRNQGDYRDHLAADTYRKLADFFRPHNQQLYEYLNQDFGW
ncbi:MAG: sulfotransferase domain-containing protein [Anaerolineales bacterium]|nr:sulfotransferase domain-containing protein [Anaerolineales bacterium]